MPDIEYSRQNIHAETCLIKAYLIFDFLKLPQKRDLLFTIS